MIFTFSFFLLFSFLSTLSRETPTFGVHFLVLGVSGGPPAAWAPEGSTYSFYQHSRAKRLSSLLVASWALLGPGCPRALSGSSSSILYAGAVFGDTHVAVCYTWLLLCLSWRPPYIVKTKSAIALAVRRVRRMCIFDCIQGFVLYIKGQEPLGITRTRGLPPPFFEVIF